MFGKRTEKDARQVELEIARAPVLSYFFKPSHFHGVFDSMKMRSRLPWLAMAVVMLVLMGSDLGAMGDKLMLMLALMLILMSFWMKSSRD